MSNTMSLQQSVMMDVAALMNDNKAMTRLRAVLDELKDKPGTKDNKMTASEKTAILNDIRDGMREVQLEREGKIKLKSAKELLDELRS